MREGSAIYLDEKTLARFWSKVDKRGPDECWEWRGKFTNHGSATLSVGGKELMVTRLMWSLAGREPEKCVRKGPIGWRDRLNKTPQDGDQGLALDFGEVRPGGEELVQFAVGDAEVVVSDQGGSVVIFGEALQHLVKCLALRLGERWPGSEQVGDARIGDIFWINH